MVHALFSHTWHYESIFFLCNHSCKSLEFSARNKPRSLQTKVLYSSSSIAGAASAVALLELR